jgi:hypothetical protein
MFGREDIVDLSSMKGGLDEEQIWPTEKAQGAKCMIYSYFLCVKRALLLWTEVSA